MTPMTTRPVRDRRVRHDVADGAAVMAFSLSVSLGLAAAIALVLGLIGGLW